MRISLAALGVALITSPSFADADFAAAVFYETGSIQEAVAIVDLDGDGDNDLAVIHRDGTLKTLANLGAGTFAPAVSRGVLWPSGTACELVVADVDRDGDQDLLVAFTTIYGAVSVVLNRGDGSFDPPVNYDSCYSTQMIVAADLDGDKRVDVAGDTVCFAASILINNGDGTFRHNGDFGRGYTPGGIDAGDTDGDGDLDIAFGNGTSDVLVIPNNGDGTFGLQGGQVVNSNPQDVKMADFDGDGDLDIVSSNFYENYLSFLRNDGSGGFPTSEDFYAEWGGENMAVADFDRDGDLDIVIADRDSDRISILHNPGNGVFTARRDEPAGDGPEDVAWGDLDGDALPDVAVTHWESSRVAVYINATEVPADIDGDGVTGAQDCAPAQASAWAVPGGIGDLLLDGREATRLSWSAPSAPGGSVPRFDVLRSSSPSDFSSASCVEANGTDRVATDPTAPSDLLAYLVRVRNACGGNVGTSSSGAPRVVASCP
jgi:VCBS repeat protein